MLICSTRILCDDYDDDDSYNNNNNNNNNSNSNSNSNNNGMAIIAFIRYPIYIQL